MSKIRSGRSSKRSKRPSTQSSAKESCMPFKDRITTNQTPEHVGEEIDVYGWIHTRRDHGKLTFFDLRDRWGLLQIVATADTDGPVKELRPEYVVRIHGTVVKRPEKLINTSISSGTVELQASKIEI